MKDSEINSMKYIQGKDRNQTYLFPTSMDDSIGEDNEVRIIDLFVDSLKLQDFGFNTHRPENGRPAYHPKVLLKLFIYGYMNKIRSSRDLEKETKRNIEVMWLVNALSPDHNTISNFRRDNPKSIKKVFRATVQVAKHFDLIGGKLIAGDSTKLRAQNSKKNNYNQKKIERHVAYIDQKLEEYSQLLAVTDDDEKEEIKRNIDKHKTRKANYKKLEKQLKDTGEKQISTSDPESRQMIVRNNITEVAYNVQSTVDSKHNLPFDYKVTNNNDSKAMGNMLQRAKSILRTNEFTALYDKGYHTGSEFKIANDLGIDVLVAIPSAASQAPNPNYSVEHFKYDEAEDCYICPQQHKLTSSGTIHKARTYYFKRYTTKACMSCKVKSECTKARYGKGVQRSEYQRYINNNKERIEQNENYYRKRQAIVEHPYGTIKRQWGFNHVLTKKGMEKASADVGLIFTAYNLKRIVNIIGLEQFRKYLKAIIRVVLATMTYKCVVKCNISALKGLRQFLGSITHIPGFFQKLALGFEIKPAF
jgi:transposase